MAYHLSVFVENRPGKLERITKILAERGINLRAVSVASAGEFGIIRLLVNDPGKAAEALREGNLTVSERRVIVALIEDRPGGLHELLATLSAGDINVEDCYGFVLEERATAAVVIEVEKNPEAEEVLARRGVRLLTDKEIYSV